MFKPENTILVSPQNDLESKTILKIAREIGIEVRASRQVWGARLENEPDGIFNNPGKKDFWIVEIPGPEKEAALKNEGYALTIIDHHEYKGLNRYNDLSSLEQFAKKCGYELSSEKEKRIAINDRSYIWGLISEGVSLEDIMAIRKEEMQLQGWTPDDFAANEAELMSIRVAIAKYLGEPEAFFVHETTLQKTGHFVDLFHLPDQRQYQLYRNSKESHPRWNLLLIKKGSGIVLEFSGLKKCRDKVLEAFFPMAGNYWLGGAGIFGFAGIEIQSAIDLKEVKKKVKDILDSEKKEPVCSIPVRPHEAPIKKFTTFFLFPFHFQKNENPGGMWEKETPLKIPLDQGDLQKGWEYQQNYAEYIYFHDYVRSFIFPSQKDIDEDLKDEKSWKCSHFYKYQQEEPVICKMETVKDHKPFELSAMVNGIYMHRYPGNIGILAIETSNTSDKDEWREKLDARFYIENNFVKTGEDLLLFNNMFRRVYPAYFEKGNFSEQVDNSEFPKSIKFTDVDGKEIGFGDKKTSSGFKFSDMENIHFFNAKEGRKYYPTPAQYVIDLVEHFLNLQTKGNIPNFTPVLDDRMLVYSSLAFDNLNQYPILPGSRDIFFAYFLYVDNLDYAGKEYRYDAAFTEQLLKDATYNRWINYETRMGFSRYSAVFQYDSYLECLYRPFVSMHYQMFLLNVYYRARLIRFSDEVARIAEKWTPEVSKHSQLPTQIKKEHRILHADFMQFMNVFWFVEVTNQDQGIEMFQKMRQSFALEPMYEQVKDEIERSDELADLFHNEKVERFNTKAGIIGGIIGVLAVLTGFFGMNFSGIAGKGGVFNSNQFMSWAIGFVIVGMLWIFGIAFLEKRWRVVLRWVWLFVSMIVALIIAKATFVFFWPV